MHLRLAVLVLVFAIAELPAQVWETDSAQASLVLNGVDGGPPLAPNVATVLIPGPLEFQIAANPLVPFLLLVAPGLDNASFPVLTEQLDLGPVGQLAILLNGLEPGFFNTFAVTDAAGTVAFSIPLPPGYPVGPAGAFQTVVVDPTVVGGVRLSAAADLDVVAPLNFGSIHYGRGATSTSLRTFDAITGAGAPIAGAIPSTNFALQPIVLNRITQFVTADGPSSDVDARVPPTPAQPRRVVDNTDFPYIRTVHGDIYRFASNADARSGFMLVDAAGTRRLHPQVGDSSLATWMPRIAMDATSSTMVASRSTCPPTGSCTHPTCFRVASASSTQAPAATGSSDRPTPDEARIARRSAATAGSWTLTS